MPNRTKDDLWERQPGESAQAYEAFAIYRDMGSNRSLRVVAEQLSKSDTLIKRWSREKKWGERCRAYDNHLDDVARQEALRKYKKMRTRHIGIALQLQEKALAELKNLPDGSMTPKDIIQFLDKATELERDNRMEEAGVAPEARRRRSRRKPRFPSPMKSRPHTRTGNEENRHDDPRGYPVLRRPPG